MTADGERFLRLTATAGIALERFEMNRAEWSVRTPRDEIAAAAAQLAVVGRAGARALGSVRWPPRVRRLIRRQERGVRAVLAAAVPPAILTTAALAAWNARLDRATEEAAPAAAELRLALGLPALGPAYLR